MSDKEICYVLRKEKDGTIIAVYNQHFNNSGDDLLAVSMSDGHFSVSRSYVRNKTSKASLEESKEIYNYMLSNGCKLVNRLNVR